MPGVDQLAYDLAAISARLREIGDGGLARELSRAVGRAVDQVPDQVRAGLKPRLPDPYAAVLEADLRFSRRTFTSGDEARVSLYATAGGIKKRKLQRLDDGILWHPLFGRFPRTDPRNRWFMQEAPSVLPGWFSGPARDAAPQVREAISRALDEVAAKAAGKGIL